MVWIAKNVMVRPQSMLNFKPQTRVIQQANSLSILTNYQDNKTWIFVDCVMGED